MFNFPKNSHFIALLFTVIMLFLPIEHCLSCLSPQLDYDAILVILPFLLFENAKTQTKRTFSRDWQGGRSICFLFFIFLV